MLRNVFVSSIANDSFSVSSLFSLVLFLGTKSFCQRIIVLLLLTKEDRREFLLTRNFSSVRSTISFCSSNKPYSSINAHRKVCDQKIELFVSKFQSACIGFHEQALRTSEKHVRTLCAAEVIFICFPSAFQQPFFRGKFYIHMKFSFGIRVKTALKCRACISPIQAPKYTQKYALFMNSPLPSVYLSTSKI